jgi:hypothetical protein
MPARCPPQRLEPLRRRSQRIAFIAMCKTKADENPRPVSGLAGCVRVHVSRIAFPRHAVA